MKSFLTFFLTTLCMVSIAQNKDTRYFEMRTYYTPEGKLPDLIKRFADHTTKLFEKQGMQNIGYFVPVDESRKDVLIYFLAYPDKASRDRMWNAFKEDPAWNAARTKSEENGPLVKSVDQLFLTVAPELSPKIESSKGKKGKVYELRTYTCAPGRLDALTARFRDHTRALFKKHGMTNVAYWYTVEEDGVQPKLVYLLAHDSEAAGKASFDAFRNDPAWVKARDASEADGKIVEKVESVYLKPLPFSKLK